MAQTAISLNVALDKIAAYLNLDAEQLRDYAQEDTVGGWHENKTLAKWIVGSVWEVEGQILYALVRALKPARSLEVGYFYGCSLSHMAEALMANGAGAIETVDKYPMAEIPDRYTSIARLIRADAFQWQWNGGYDFVFEDAAHSNHLAAHIWQEFNAHAPSGAVIVSHDSEHYLVGQAVREGLETVTHDYLSLLVDPGRCGLAIWRKP